MAIAACSSQSGQAGVQQTLACSTLSSLACNLGKCIKQTKTVCTAMQVNRHCKGPSE